MNIKDNLFHSLTYLHLPKANSTPAMSTKKKPREIEAFLLILLRELYPLQLVPTTSSEVWNFNGGGIVV